MWAWKRGWGRGSRAGGLGPGKAIGRGLLPGGLNLSSEIGILGRVGEMGAETAVGQGTVLTAQGPQVRVPVCSAFSLDHPGSLQKSGSSRAKLVLPSLPLQALLQRFPQLGGPGMQPCMGISKAGQGLGLFCFCRSHYPTKLLKALG